MCEINVNLAAINVWLDVVFSSLLVVILVALVIHYIGTILKGRWKMKWIEGKWPIHEEPHPPALPKLIHFSHMSMMVVLAFTGMYIRFPFFYGGRTAMRWIHYVAMTIVGFTFFWRLWYAFYSKNRDWKEFAVGKKDMASLIGVAMYYALVSDKKPHVAKYNVLQKLSYDGFGLLMIVQGISGLALIMTPFIFGYSPRFLLTFWWADIIGGVAMAGAWARVVHYTVNWLFIVITTIHIYLSGTEDVPVALDFFGITYPGYIAPGHEAPHHGELPGHGGHGGHGEEPALGPGEATEALAES